MLTLNWIKLVLGGCVGVQYLVEGCDNVDVDTFFFFRYKYLPTPLTEHKVMCTAHGPFFGETTVFYAFYLKWGQLAYQDTFWPKGWPRKKANVKPVLPIPSCTCMLVTKALPLTWLCLGKMLAEEVGHDWPLHVRTAGGHHLIVTKQTTILWQDLASISDDFSHFNY